VNDVDHECHAYIVTVRMGIQRSLESLRKPIKVLSWVVRKVERTLLILGMMRPIRIVAVSHLSSFRRDRTLIVLFRRGESHSGVWKPSNTQRNGG
jgi:hypothetical protein